MLELHLLGPLRIEQDGQAPPASGGAKAQALLCYLAVTKEPHSRDALAALLWSEDSATKARNSLRVALSQIRRLLPDGIVADRQHVALNGPIWLDIDALVALGPRLEEAPQDALETAARQIRGEFLAELDLEGAPEFENWLTVQRRYWQQLSVEVLQALAERYLTALEIDRAIVTLRRLLLLAPWEEHAHRRLMVALTARGDFNGALAQYDAGRELLERELGVEPMPETIALAERIRRARRTRRASLPASPTPFVGRVTELARLQAYLHDQRCQLVSIVGLGGVGKTRLALEAARWAQSVMTLAFLNGVFFVPLAGVTAPALVPGTLATALNITLAGERDEAGELVRQLQGLALLLVLDNVEHLLRPATEGGRSLLSLLQRILAECPDVKLLVTSRAPLNIGAEWRVDLAGLAVPAEAPRPGEAITHYGAAELLRQTAVQVRPDFRLTPENAADVYALCRLVAGIPLAIQLAARWLRTLTLAEVVAEVQSNLDMLAAELADMPERQRSMRAVFESAWAALKPEERLTLQALTVFRGGFTSEAAQEVAGVRPAMLAALGDHGLVQPADTARFTVHELLRQYAAAQPRVSDEDNVVYNRHCTYYLHFAAQHNAKLNGGEQVGAIKTLEADIDNVRVAWTCAGKNENWENLRVAADSLYIYFQHRCLYRQGVAFFEETLSELDAAVPSPERDLTLAEILVHLGWLLVRRGRLAEARQHLKRSLALYEALHAPAPPNRMATDPRTPLSILALLDGDYESALSLAREALALAEANNDPGNEMVAHYALASAALAQGDYAEAKTRAECTRRLAEARGNRWFEAYALNDLGNIALAEGDLEQATARFQACYDIRETFNDPQGMALALCNLGYMATLRGDYLTAGRQLDESQGLYKQIGDRGGYIQALTNRGLNALAQARTRRAAVLLSQALDLSEELHALPLTLTVSLAIGDWLQACGAQEEAQALYNLVATHAATETVTRRRAQKRLIVAVDSSHHDRSARALSDATFESVVDRVKMLAGPPLRAARHAEPAQPPNAAVWRRRPSPRPLTGVD